MWCGAGDHQNITHPLWIMNSTIKEGKTSLGEQPRALGNSGLVSVSHESNVGGEQTLPPVSNGGGVGDDWQSVTPENENLVWADEETEEMVASRRAKEDETKRRERREEMRREREEEDRLCLTWWKECNNYGNRYAAPTPKYLVIKDKGRRQFSREDIMKKTAWLGSALNIRSRADLPSMRIVKIKGEQCVSLHTENTEIAEKIMNMSAIGPCEVTVEKDSLKNSVVGVLYDAGGILSNSSEDGIKELLENQGVTKVINLRKGKDKQPTLSYKIIFDKLQCPEGVDINRNWFKVREFIPPPLRCFRCQKYEHAVRGCRDKGGPTCQRCGEKGHEKLEFNDQRVVVNRCNRPMKCANCGREHEAGDRECQKQKDYKRVNEIKVNQKLSMQEAKLRVFGASSSARTDVQVVAAENPQRAESLQSTVIENENKAAIQSLHAKLDRVLAGIVARPAQEVNEGPADSIKDQVQREVEAAVSSIRTELNRVRTEGETRHNHLQKRVDEQEKTIDKLTAEKERLKEETDVLREQLAAANAAKEQLQKELKQQKDGKAEVASRKHKHDSDSPDRPSKFSNAERRASSLTRPSTTPKQGSNVAKPPSKDNTKPILVPKRSDTVKRGDPRRTEPVKKDNHPDKGGRIH